MLRFLLGLLWALATAICAGIGLGSLFAAVRYALGVGLAESLAGVMAGVFLMLTWILYRLGHKRFLP